MEHKKENKKQKHICPGCGKEIDPTICWCGEYSDEHISYYQNHSFIPMGCKCYKADED